MDRVPHCHIYRDWPAFAPFQAAVNAFLTKGATFVP